MSPLSWAVGARRPPASSRALGGRLFEVVAAGIGVASEHDDDLAILLLLGEHESGVVVLVAQLLIRPAIEEVLGHLLVTLLGRVQQCRLRRERGRDRLLLIDIRLQIKEHPDDWQVVLLGGPNQRLPLISG